jgi:hypothetical protein
LRSAQSLNDKIELLSYFASAHDRDNWYDRSQRKRF